MFEENIVVTYTHDRESEFSIMLWKKRVYV